MNLTSPSQVKAWCIEHDFHPNKTLGQNFLVDRNVLEAIVEAGLDGVAPEEGVLEIGPGLGVMTEALLDTGRRVVAIEKDPVLAERLAQGADALARRYAGLTVFAGDALDRRVLDDALGAIASPHPQGPALVSNLPYQAGTRIILELAQARAVRQMTVLLQTEVAERLSAPEGGRSRSLAGVWAQLDYDVESVRKVSASCFWPRPEVGSTVVRLRRHGRNDAFTEAERALFRRVTKMAFAHRRKMLSTVFKTVEPTLLGLAPGSPVRIRQDFATKRPEALSVDDWIALTKGVAGNEDA